MRNGDFIKVGDTSFNVVIEGANDKQAPVACIKCGKLIAVDERDALAHIGGTFYVTIAKGNWLHLRPLEKRCENCRGQRAR